jgi:hypothetical protein
MQHENEALSDEVEERWSKYCEIVVRNGDCWHGTTFRRVRTELENEVEHEEEEEIRNFGMIYVPQEDWSSF